MPNEKQPMDKVYGEMIYSLLTEMNGSLTAALRNTNNGNANTQRIMLDLQVSINNLSASLKETRDKRYEEEINSLELQMDNLRKQLEEKKIAKNTAGSTSEKIEQVLAKREQAELKRKRIDWIAVRNQLVPYILGALILAIILYLLPGLGHFLEVVFSTK